jgi:hypothetical protein
LAVSLPAGRLGLPRELAECAALMVSDRGFMNREVVIVDGAVA